MKKFILAAALIAPLAAAAPALAQGAGDAAGFIETPALTTYAPNQAREFTARAERGTAGQSVGVNEAERSLILREVVPSSAFPTN